MKTIITLMGILFFTITPFNSFAKDINRAMESAELSNKKHTGLDERTVLEIPPAIKSHQLSNMRSHLEAVQSIIGFLEKGSFDQAAFIAGDQLGSEDKAKTMWDSYENEVFRNLGEEFHESGDKLRDALQTKDLKKSLSALNATMGYCVKCHSMFRQ